LAGGAAGEDPGPREVRGGGRGPRAQDDRAGKGGRESPSAAGAGEGGAESGVSFELDPAAETGAEHLVDNQARLLARVQRLELRVRKAEERRRALLHVLGDMNELNGRLARQRKAMLNILLDYEQDRRRLAGQTDRQHNSRRALVQIL